MGSIARRHIANLKAERPDIEIAVLRRPSSTDSKGKADEHIDEVFVEMNHALSWAPDFALITNPAPLHIDAGVQLAHNDIHLFIEKPISDTLAGTIDLLDLCDKRQLTVMIGYGFRFYPPLQLIHQALQRGDIGIPFFFRAEVGQYLPDWRPDVDYRNCVSANANLGGGAVLELSHELDYTRWLMGEVVQVQAHLGYSGIIDVDVEDTADINVQFAGGGSGQIHLDMLQRPQCRVCKIAGSEGTLDWNGATHQVRLFHADVGEWVDLHPAGVFDFNEVYRAQIRCFIRCISEDIEPPVGVSDALKTLALALAIKESHVRQGPVTI